MGSLVFDVLHRKSRADPALASSSRRWASDYEYVDDSFQDVLGCTAVRLLGCSGLVRATFWDNNEVEECISPFPA